MIRKILSISLIVSLLAVSVFEPAYSQPNQEIEAAFLKEKMKGVVSSLGTGEKVRVQVRLKEGSKVKGYIRETTDEHFVLIASETNEAITIDYSRVQDIKKIRNTRYLKFGFILTGIALGILYVVKGREN